MKRVLFIALATLPAYYASCDVSVTASRSYVDRKTIVTSVTNDGVEVGFFIGTNTNKVFASTNFMAGSSSVQVVPPSTNASSGAAADARSTGIALFTGYTEWECDNQSCSIVRNGSGWAPVYKSSPEYTIGTVKGNADSCDLSWSYDDAQENIVATRRRITPEKTSQLVNDGSNGVPFATVSDIPSDVKSDRITDGTNIIDAAGNVYKVKAGWSALLSASGVASSSTPEEIVEKMDLGDPVYGSGTSAMGDPVTGWFVSQTQAQGEYDGQHGYDYIGVQGGPGARELTYNSDFDWDGEGSIVTVSGAFRLDAPVVVGTLALTNNIPETTLHPLYGGNREKYGEWTILREGTNVTSQVQQPYYYGHFDWNVDGVPGDFATGTAFGSEDSLALEWVCVDANENQISYSATRAQNQIVGYTLGSQTNNPIQAASLLYGKTYDFATNVGLYTAVRDLILALGGSVTNFPSIGGN